MNYKCKEIVLIRCKAVGKSREKKCKDVCGAIVWMCRSEQRCSVRDKLESPSVLLCHLLSRSPKHHGAHLPPSLGFVVP